MTALEPHPEDPVSSSSDSNADPSPLELTPPEEAGVKLSPLLWILGILAILVGLLTGFVMSSMSLRS